MRKFILAFASLLVSGIVLAGPPVLVRNSRNEVVGRVYQHGKSADFYGRYNERVGSYRQLTPSIGQFRDSRGIASGSITKRGK